MFSFLKIVGYRGLLLAFLLGIAQGVSAQTGGIYGTITDKKAHKEVIGAAVQVFQKNVLMGDAVTNLEGKYKIKPLQPGSDYEIRVRIVGFKEMQVKNVLVNPDRVTYQNLTLEENSKGLDEVTMVEYRETSAPLKLGRIKSDKKSLKRTMYSGLEPITRSKKIIEIRLVGWSVSGLKSISVLSYACDRWTLKRYSDIEFKDSISLVCTDTGSVSDTLLKILVQNNIFYLPDEPEPITFILDDDRSNILQSIAYPWYCTPCSLVEFKVGKKFRRYKICEACTLAPDYPEISEYQNYCNIEEAFGNAVADLKRIK